MAENRFYWIKLKLNMLTSKTVDFLMSQKGGANYVLLYQMLCLLTINSNGELADYIGEVIIPFDEAKIQRDTKYFNIDTIRVALELYKKLGLIYVQENGILKIADFENLIGSESKWAGYKRKERLDNVQMLSNEMSNESPLRDKSIDNRDKDINSINNSIINNTSAEQSKDSSPVFIKLPLNTGENYSVYESDIEKYVQLYPAVDVKQELRNMLGWLESNPKNRKTKNGIKSFITRWLNKRQDQAGKVVDISNVKYKTNGFESIDDNYRKSKSNYNPGEFETL